MSCVPTKEPKKAPGNIGRQWRSARDSGIIWSRASSLRFFVVPQRKCSPKGTARTRILYLGQSIALLSSALCMPGIWPSKAVEATPNKCKNEGRMPELVRQSCRRNCASEGCPMYSHKVWWKPLEGWDPSCPLRTVDFSPLSIGAIIERGTFGNSLCNRALRRLD